MAYSIPMTDAIRKVEDTRTRQVMRLARYAERLVTLQVTESNWADIEDLLDEVQSALDDIGDAFADNFAD